MKVTYIYHSGFAVELDNCILLFDYYKGELPRWEKNKMIYVFASHKHQDHFQLKIFDLAKEYPKIHYFLGSDIKLNGKYLERKNIAPSIKENITNVGKNKRLSFDKIEILSLRSTDEGVAFIGMGSLTPSMKIWLKTTRRKSTPFKECTLMRHLFP